jgi:xanthine dehydrogenase iron-sulfur cluster and FAD-binding subunit A
MVQRYINAANLTDAIQILAKEKGSARIIAGATDLMLEIERGTRKGIETLVDISRAKETNFITLDESGWIHLGPTVTHNQAASSKLIHEYGLPLALACWSVGSPQIRNRGTIAGNLVTASPANDTIPALTVLQAEVTLASSRGVRKVKLSDFYTGVRKTVLAEDELVADIAFPCLIPNQRGVFVKSALRKAQAISVVNAALVLEMENEIISNAIIALGAVAPTIIRASSCEKKLIGQKISYEVIEEASREVEKDIHPISDLRGSDVYRLSAVKNSVKQALSLIFEDKALEGFPTDPIVLQGAKPFQMVPLSETCEYSFKNLVKTTINQQSFSGNAEGYPNLLRFLRDEAGLIGTKEGCAEGECGACTIYLDGNAVMGCLVPVFRADQAQIGTIEGIRSKPGELHPVQQAFIDEGAVQCGYCTPGFVMSSVKLLEERENPSREEIAQALTGNLCRCTGYYQIIKAVETASSRKR